MKLPFVGSTLPQISPLELKSELDGNNPPTLLDVRETEELAISHLEGALHIPMRQLPYRLSELDPNAHWVVVCRSGHRSSSVVRYLIENGFTSVRNLSTGMNGWSRDVDPNVQKY